jgi:hypothetical protein
MSVVLQCSDTIWNFQIGILNVPETEASLHELVLANHMCTHGNLYLIILKQGLFLPKIFVRMR